MQETARFKERLEAERERICRQMELAESEVVNQDHSIQDAMPQSGDDEIADAASGTYTQELEAALVRRAQNRLATVDSALERMQVGQFGNCVHCGRTIAVGRLEALPWTPYCIDCAQELEVLD